MRARPAGDAARRPRAVRQGRLGQPSDLFVQGSRRLGRGHARRRARLHGVRLRVDRQPRRQRRRRTPRASGSRCSVFIPDDLEAGKVAGASVYRPRIIAVRGNYDDVNRLCTQVADQVRLGLREHQPARVLRRGREDLRVRDRRAARLALPAPRRLARRRRHAAAAHPQGIRRAADASAWSTASCRRSMPRRRPAARRSFSALEAGLEFPEPVKPKTIAKSIAIGNPADGFQVLRAVRVDRRRRRDGRGGRDRRGHPAARRDRRHLHRSRPAASRSRRRSSSSSAARIPRDESIVICITGNGYKTIEVLNGKGVEPIRIGRVARGLRGRSRRCRAREPVSAHA